MGSPINVFLGIRFEFYIVQLINDKEGFYQAQALYSMTFLKQNPLG